MYTLQYYDKENILKPSGKSEGGRRLYTHKDIVKLHQIQSMKYLGFSLENIKVQLPSLDSPDEVADVPLGQPKTIREKIDSLTDVLKSIEKLNTEVLQMKTVDWVKYADIVVLLQAKSEMYWAMKHFSDKVFDHVHSLDKETQDIIVKAQKKLFEKASELQKKGIAPQSEQGQSFAKDFWDTIMEFTGGDMSLLPELNELACKHGDSTWKDKQPFIEKALDAYFISLEYNPF